MYKPQSLVVGIILIVSEKPREYKLLVFLHEKTGLYKPEKKLPILGRIKLIHVLHINLSSLTLIEVGVGFWFGLVFSDSGVVSYYQ